MTPTTLQCSVIGPHLSLLSSWLRPGPTGARGLIFEKAYPEIDVPMLQLLRSEVIATHNKYRGTPSVLITPVAELVRGNPSGDRVVRPASDALTMDQLSLWERAFIAATAECHDHPDENSTLYLAGNDPERAKHLTAFINLRVELHDLHLPVLDTAGVFVLTSASLDEARARAHAMAFTTRTSLMWTESASERDAWIHWLSGTAGATLPTVAATHADSEALLAALRGEWSLCNDLTPMRERRFHLKPIRAAAEETMLMQMLRQIWTHREGAGPAVDVLRESLAVLFSHWGKAADDPWHAGLGVGARLPLLGLVARFAANTGDVVDPVALLYEQRAHIPHLVTPPTVTFTLPPDVDAAFTAYVDLLNEAIVLGGRFVRAFHDNGHTLRLVQVAPREPPAPVTPTPVAQMNGGLRFRCVIDQHPGVTFVLPVVPGETVRELKERVNTRSPTPGAEFCALSAGGRYLKLVESVDALLGGDGGASIDVVWTTCSHGAAANPMTGASTCFWDGSGGPVENAEY